MHLSLYNSKLTHIQKIWQKYICIFVFVAKREFIMFVSKKAFGKPESYVEKQI